MPCSADLMLPGVDINGGEETIKELKKGQPCAIAVVGNRYVNDKDKHCT